MSLSLDVAVGNLAILRTFVEGNKPVYDKYTGEISIEDREKLVGLRRWFWGAFKPENLNPTLQVTLSVLKADVIKLYDENDKDAVERHENLTKVIGRDFLPALEGIKNIAQTYLIKDKNKDTAGKVRNIYKYFKQQYKEAAKINTYIIPVAPSPPVLEEKKNYTKSVVEAVKASAAARSKKITAHYEQDLQGDFRDELKKKLTVPLRKVEKNTSAASEPEAPRGFNVSMLRKVPQKKNEDTEIENDEWATEKKVPQKKQEDTQVEKDERATEKAPLIRSQSVFIPRPAPSIHQSNTDKDAIKARIDFFTSKITERRKGLGEKK